MYSLLQSRAVQTRLSYFVDCIDFPPRDGEITYPILIGWVAGFEEQLAPRENAKAPRNVFVGSLAMEMDQ
jgi:hypothetical protein